MIIKSLILVSALTSLVAAKVEHSFDTTRFICDDRPHKSIFDFAKKDIPPVERKLPGITIENCPFPADEFRVVDFIDKIGLTDITQLVIASPKSPPKREHLSGLSLDSLEFANTNLQEYSDDLLQDVELRSDLIIKGSSLTRVPKHLFKSKSVAGVKSLAIMFTGLKKISRDDFASLTNLTELLLYKNHIEEIEEGALNGIESLELLELSFNKLKSLPAAFLHKLKNLRSVNLGGNQFTELPADLLVENTKLRRFRAGFNRGITSLPTGLFKSLRNLEFVQLVNNGLTSLSADLFSGLTLLKGVELEGNKIDELPAGIFDDAVELKMVNLQNNELTSLPENLFGKNKVLESLKLNNNAIAKLPGGVFDGAVELKSLDLAGNELTNLPDNIFSKNKLQELNLNDNKLTSITGDHLEGLNKLKVLYVARNSLSYIYRDTLCDKLESLEEIDVSHNHLNLTSGLLGFSTMKPLSTFMQCRFLTKINASYNNVYTMFEDFSYLARLKDIDFSNNQIEKLSAVDIQNLRNPNVHLNLENNKISTIDLKELESYTKYCKYETSDAIDVRNNPIHCDCKVRDLVRYLQDDMEESVYNCVHLKARNLQCASPPELANRKVISLSMSELSCPAQ